LPSPEKRSQTGLLLVQELRSLLLSPVLWGMFITMSLLTGYSFIEAVDLFARASKTAASFAELAAGMNPLQGILVPTFGACYLVETLLLPFVAIRLIGLDKQTGTLKLLLQLPLSTTALCGIKVGAMGLVWLFSLLPIGLALLIFHVLGGHVHLPEVVLLFAAHGLYGLSIIVIAMFAAAISDSLPTAAMLSLAVTLGLWVLDFAAAGHQGFPAVLGSLSLTGLLRQMENGLLTSRPPAVFGTVILFFFFLTVLWIHPGRRRFVKMAGSLGLLLCLAWLPIAAQLVHGSLDVTENRIHSFAPEDAAALRGLDDTLTLTIHMDPLDSRYQDLQRDLLAKLRRTVRHLEVRTRGSGRMFAAAGDDTYGMIEIACRGKKEQTYSNSAEEILPIIYSLAGIKVVHAPAPGYPGYPLVADARPSRWLFYVVLPLFFLGAGIYCRKRGL